MITSREFMTIATDGARLQPGQEPKTRPTHQDFWDELAQYALETMRGGQAIGASRPEVEATPETD